MYRSWVLALVQPENRQIELSFTVSTAVVLGKMMAQYTVY